MKNCVSLFFYLFLVLCETIAFFYLKIFNSELSLSEINFLVLGNIVCSILFLLAAVSPFFLFFKENFQRKIRQLLKISSFEILFLAVSLLISFKVIIVKENYIFFYSTKKILIAFFLSLFLYLIICKISFCFFATKNFLVKTRTINLYAALFFPFSFFFFFLYTLQRLDAAKEYYSFRKKPADICVVLGAAVWKKDKPSPILYGRIIKAKEFYLNGFAKKILLTGANAPGELSEAKTAYNTLLRLGIPSKAMIYEEKTRSTSEQILLLKKLIENNSNIRIAIISDSFHLARIRDIINYYSFEADLLASDYVLQWNKWIYYRARESVALFLFHFFGI